jgi:hypothetical protein
MNYYKILNEKEKHYGLQYKYGLNIDPVPFDPSGDCRRGGIYFAREDILSFLHYGPWIRKVTIPEDAFVYENPGTPKKWKADRVILGKKEKITAKVIKKLIEEGANVNGDDNPVNTPLRWAINGHHDKIIKILLEAGADPSVHSSLALQQAIFNNDIKNIKVLLKAKVEVQIFDCYPLQVAAKHGHIKIFKLLLSHSCVSKYILKRISDDCKNLEIQQIINKYIEKNKLDI